MITSGTVGPVLFQEGIRKLLGNSYKRLPLEGAKWLNMQTTKKAFEVDREVSTIGSIGYKAELVPMAVYTPRVGRAKTYQTFTMGGSIGVSWEAEMDEQYGFIRKELNGLGDATREAQNLEMAKAFLLCDSGDTGALTGFDGLSLLNTAHTGPEGEAITYNSNRVLLDLSDSALQTVLIQGQNAMDPQGNRINLNFTKLITLPQNMFLVRELFESEKKPYTPDNTTNVLRNALQVVILRYGYGETNGDRWLVQDPGHDLNFLMRVAPTMDQFEDKQIAGMIYTIKTRMAGPGFGLWQHFIGSPGAP